MELGLQISRYLVSLIDLFYAKEVVVPYGWYMRTVGNDRDCNYSGLRDSGLAKTTGISRFGIAGLQTLPMNPGIEISVMLWVGQISHQRCALPGTQITILTQLVLLPLL